MFDDPVREQVALRAPGKVMRLSRMGAMFPTRLSFLRSLLRRLMHDGARVERRVWNMYSDGFGHAVYCLTLGGHTYSLVAVSTDLPDEMRTDRVIATAWDTSYTLYEGVPDAAELARLVQSLPLQEAARFSARELILSRANKSVRLFAHVVQSLREGRQPDPALIGQVGYLMRTTAVYGNGKFGIADRDAFADRPGLEGPFAAEMLTVWLIRHFTHDLVEHIGGRPLDRALKRQLGIGNATGLGMAPFLVNHPVLLNNWMMARETALARVCALQALTTQQQHRLRTLAQRAASHLREWNVSDPAHQARIVSLRKDWNIFCASIDLTVQQPLKIALQAASTCSVDLQELAVAWMIEPFGDLVDDLTADMVDHGGHVYPPLTDTGQLGALIRAQAGWALDADYSDPKNCAKFWYVSANKHEPRLGSRFEEPGAALESPLDIGRRIKACFDDLPPSVTPLSEFLAHHPEHAFIAKRLQSLPQHPYSEIRDNLIADTCRPIDMLRCKLAFFGAAKFDPKSELWTRITLCQGAPLGDELPLAVDDWWLPSFAA
ncbi:MAG: hypothetical protein AAF755_06120 [Pseudomonadota bacterium]